MADHCGIIGAPLGINMDIIIDVGYSLYESYSLCSRKPVNCPITIYSEELLLQQSAADVLISHLNNTTHDVISDARPLGGLHSVYCPGGHKSACFNEKNSLRH